MRAPRTAAVAVLLVAEAVVAAAGVAMHWVLTVEYGDVTDSVLEGLAAGFSAGLGGLALLLVSLVGAAAVATSRHRGTRLAALAIPALMVGAMVVLTPAGLRQKLEVQYDATPRCVQEDTGGGAGARAQRESQRALESVEHVGHFGGGGGSGLGGCDRSFVLTEDTDVMGHYRKALPRAGWRIVRSDKDHLRAERDGMAIAVLACRGGGVIWAGEDHLPDPARCDGHARVSA